MFCGEVSAWKDRSVLSVVPPLPSPSPLPRVSCRPFPSVPIPHPSPVPPLPLRSLEKEKKCVARKQNQQYFENTILQ